MTDIDHISLEYDCKDLQLRYDGLQKELCLVDKDLTDKENQYLSTKQGEAHYLSEVEILKSRDISELEGLEYKIKQRKLFINEEFTQECTEFDHELGKYQTELSALKEQSIAPDHNETLAEVEIDYHLLALNDALSIEFNLRIQERDELQIHTTNLKKELTPLNESYELEEKYNSIAEELLESESVLNDLDEELALIKNQLTIVKRPLTQINDTDSLFSEVNDRRIELRNETESLKSKCSDITNQIILDQKRLFNIKYLKEELEHYKKIFIQESDNIQLSSANAYMNHKRILEQICEEYIKDIVQKRNYNEMTRDVIDFFSKLEDYKRKRKKFIENEKDLHFRAKKLQEFRMKTVHSQIDEAKQTISNQLEPKLLELTNSIAALLNQAKQQDNNIEHKNIEIKETEVTQNFNEINQVQEKLTIKLKPKVRKVGFVEDTSQTKPVSLKRGGKNIQLKGVHISTLLKKKPS